MIRRAILLIVAFSGFAPAQQQPTADTPSENPQASLPVDRPITGPKSAEWKGLSVGEKLRYDWRHLFDVENLVFAGVGASFDQLRNRPAEWGQGWGPFGERYASHVGYYVIQRSIMFPVQAIDHEDSRYFPSTRTGYKGRLADAFLHTVWRHNDSGGMMPAYSEFLGDYGAAAISRMWWPANYHKGSSILIAGSDTVLVDAGINVLHEFKPDLKRWLHLNH
ncbi:MAG: hypothetical protein ABSG41_02505 [Bryobacteraceae bacterium]|jgi:hypothetical protein